jgi:ribonuclease-3 family protein
MKTRVVRAEAQARLLDRILPDLRPEELELVRRGRNATPSAAARGGRRHTQEYRAATGFEALVGTWCLEGDPGHARLHEVLGGPLEAAIDEAVAAAAHRPRRG